MRRKELLLFLLRIILAGAILPALLIEVPRLSRRGRALRGSRWSPELPKPLCVFTALAEVALRFNGSCQSRLPLFLLRIYSRGSDPSCLVDRGSAPIAARSRSARLPLVAGIAEAALRFNGACRIRLLLFLLRIYSRGSDPYSLSNRGSAPIAVPACRADH